MDSFFYVNLGNSQIPVLVEGNVQSNKFIVIIHGGPGGSGFDYMNNGAFERLEEDFAVVYYDQRLSGGATFSNSDHSATIPTRKEMATDLDQLTRVIKAKYGENMQLYLLGHSWGGELLCEYMSTQAYAGRIDGMISVAGLTVYNDSFQTLGENRRELILSICDTEIDEGNKDEIWTQIKNQILSHDSISGPKWHLGTHWQEGWDVSWNYIYEAGKAADRRFNNHLYHDNRVHIDGSRYESEPGQSNRGVFISENTATYLYPLLVEGRSDQSEDIKRIDAPCLIITGKYDCVVPPKTGAKLFNDISTPVKDKFYFEIDSTSHAPYRREAEFYALVRSFISQY